MSRISISILTPPFCNSNKFFTFLSFSSLSIIMISNSINFSYHNKLF
nr:MAG TPA: hypothetical protein [Caudoviricetes sp.]